ncbi:hypothetical protein RCH21_003451 [Arthrobacter sp. PL16]|nr:hypothetical protein [Arthrobacter sp. PL16]
MVVRQLQDVSTPLVMLSGFLMMLTAVALSIVEIRALCAQAIKARGENAAHELGIQLLARAGLNEGHA